MSAAADTPHCTAHDRHLPPFTLFCIAVYSITSPILWLHFQHGSCGEHCTRPGTCRAASALLPARTPSPGRRRQARCRGFRRGREHFRHLHRLMLCRAAGRAGQSGKVRCGWVPAALRCLHRARGWWARGARETRRHSPAPASPPRQQRPLVGTRTRGHHTRTVGGQHGLRQDAVAKGVALQVEREAEAKGVCDGAAHGRSGSGTAERWGERGRAGNAAADGAPRAQQPGALAHAACALPARPAAAAKRTSVAAPAA